MLLVPPVLLVPRVITAPLTRRPAHPRSPAFLLAASLACALALLVLTPEPGLAANPEPTGVEPSTPWVFAAIGAGIGFAFLVGVFLLARRQRRREDDAG